MLFDEFLKKASMELSKNLFRLSTCNKRLALYSKADGPIVYYVSIIDFDNINIVDYEASITDIMGQQLRSNKAYFNNIICINILFSSEMGSLEEFVSGKVFETGDAIHNVWWYTDGNELYFGQDQPNKIANVEKIIKKAIKDEYDCLDFTLEELEEEKNKADKKKNSKFPHLTIAIILINFAIFIFQTVTSSDNKFVLDFGLNYRLIYEQGQIYRLLTYMLIHSGIEHVLFNNLSLYIFGSRVEKNCGKLLFAVFYIVAGIAGGVLSSVFLDGFAIGASGAVFGLIGIVLILSKKGIISDINYMSMLLMAIINLGSGFLKQNIDNFGHIGGFAAGIILGALFVAFKKNNKETNRYINKDN